MMTAHPPADLIQTGMTLSGALIDHDRKRCRSVEGATADALDEDARLWTALGGAIGELAWRVRRSCAASAFCSTRPSAALVAARLAEAIDDQFDGPAWAVINAAAQARAREMGERAPAT